MFLAAAWFFSLINDLFKTIRIWNKFTLNTNCFGVSNLLSGQARVFCRVIDRRGKQSRRPFPKAARQQVCDRELSVGSRCRWPRGPIPAGVLCGFYFFTLPAAATGHDVTPGTMSSQYVRERKREYVEICFQIGFISRLSVFSGKKKAKIFGLRRMTVRPARQCYERLFGARSGVSMGWQDGQWDTGPRL